LAAGKQPLVVDIGGTNVKAWSPRGKLIERLPTGKEFTPDELLKAIQRWQKKVTCDAIAIGYPGKVVGGRPAKEPWNLGEGWVEFDFEGRCELPVRIMNDAAMQALGSYERGCMLFLGLGTSVGSALVIDGFVVPLELGSIPYSRDRSLEDMLSKKALRQGGQRRWRKAVINALPKLLYAFAADYIVLGGGNAQRMKGDVPDFVRMGGNRNAHLGGVRLWQAEDFRHVHWFPEKQAKESTQAPPTSP
jgi:polyphosphate glucokinase